MRVFGLISIVAALVGGVYLGAAQLSKATSGGTATSSAEKDAAVVAATFAARRGESTLEAYRNSTGSYAGASLTAVSGVQLVRADATSFCLKMQVHGLDLYDRGPGGEVGTEPCA